MIKYFAKLEFIIVTPFVFYYSALNLLQYYYSKFTLNFRIDFVIRVFQICIFAYVILILIILPTMKLYNLESTQLQEERFNSFCSPLQ